MERGQPGDRGAGGNPGSGRDGANRPAARLSEWRRGYRVPHQLLVRGTRDTVGKLGLGLAPEKVRLIEAAGLRVVPRLVGDEMLTADNIAATLARVADSLPPARAGHPRGVIIFDGKSVLGAGGLLDITAGELLCTITWSTAPSRAASSAAMRSWGHCCRAIWCACIAFRRMNWSP